MNRETKRSMQRRGELDGERTAASVATAGEDPDDAEDASPVYELDEGNGGGFRSGSRGGRDGGGGGGRGRGGASGRGPRDVSRRTTPAQFVREIRDELRQVAWPTRYEMVNYTAVVLTTLVIMIALIFLLNLAFGKLVLFLFHK